MDTTDAVMVFTALAQDTRLEVYKLLVEKSATGICPSHIAEELKIPRNTLSFHLSLLKQAGLCRVEKQGKILIYKPNCPKIKSIMDFLHKDCVSCLHKTDS